MMATGHTMAGEWSCSAAALVSSTAAELDRVAEPYLRSCIGFGNSRDCIDTELHCHCDLFAWRNFNFLI